MTELQLFDKEDIFQNEIDTIFSNLESEAISESNSIFWQTYLRDYEAKEWIKTNDISLYQGVSGIALFLFDGYYFTKNERYWSLFEKSSRWLERQLNYIELSNWSLYTGVLGPLLILSLNYRISKNEKYFKTIRYCLQNFKISENTPNDLLIGSAGIGLGLLHIYKNTRLLECISSLDSVIEKLLAEIEWSTSGCYWDRNPMAINGLCGFSHGVSGPALFFAELYTATDNKLFSWISEKAVEYESSKFKSEIQNWPDFRGYKFFQKDIAFDFDGIEKYSKNSRNLDMAAWCHGAPGIGMSRLSTAKINSRRSQKDLSIALNKTIRSLQAQNDSAVSLCHGIAGNSFFLIEYFRKNGLQKVIKKAQSAARKLLDIKKIKGFYPSGHSSEELNCNSLFLGTTGIAYFFLHLLHKNKRPMFNAMLPEVFGLKIDVPNQTKFLRLKKNIVIQQWVKRDFPKSYNYLSDIKDYPVDKLDIKMTDDEKSIARYEMQRNQMFRSIENFALLFKFYQHSNQRDYNLSSIISLSPFCKLFKVQFQQENLIDQSNTDLTSYFLVQNLPKMQREFRLDYFTFSLLSHFANDELPLFDQIELLKNTFESSKKNDLRDLVVSQTNLFLKQSIVVVKDPQK